MTESELDSCLTVCGTGIRLSCRIQPRASRSSVIGLYGGALKIALTAPPVDGKANASLCEFFAELFSCPKSAVVLVSGQTSRNKVIRISCVARPDAVRVLLGK